MQRPRQLIYLLLTTSIVLTLAAGGCGSSGGGGGHTTTSSGPGSGSSGGTLTGEQRTAAMQAAYARWQSLPHQDARADAQSMVDWIKTRSEFDDEGITPDGCVWAIFKDGLPYGIYNNIPPEPASATASVIISSGPASRANTEIPGSANARLFSLGSHGFENADIRTTLATMLQKAGYTSVKGTGSLADYTGIQGTDTSGASVLFTNTHGGVFPGMDKVNRFYLMTSTPQSEQQNKGVYADDLAKGRLMLVADGYYAISSEWILKYMSFPKNSLWINNVCEGFDKTFYNAAFQKGLSTYTGWDAPTNRDFSNRSALYMVDRLAGANLDTQDPVTPPQRPFDLNSIIADMNRHNPPLTRSVTTGWVWGFPIINVTANLNVANSSGPTNFGLLRPTISNLQVDDANNALVISGRFSQAGKPTVTVGAQTLTIKSADEFQITANLPGTGAGSYGPVVVTVDGHPSNTVPLTLWTGQVSVLAENLDQGTLHYNLTYSLRFRGDAHGWRNQPGTAPLAALASSFAMPDATASYTAGGSWTYDPNGTGGTIKLTYAGPGQPTGIPWSLQGSGPGNSAAAFNAYMNFDVAKGQMSVYLSAYVPNGIQTTDSVNGGPPTPGAADLLFNNQSTSLPPGALVLPINASYSTGPGQVGPVVNGGVRYTITSQGFQAVNPPDDQTSRAARLR